MKKIKVCLIGHKMAGKTSLVKKYLHDKFDEEYYPTIGVETNTICLSPIEYEDSSIIFGKEKGKGTYDSDSEREVQQNIDSISIELKIFDTSCDKKYTKYFFSSIKKSHLILIVIDLLDENIEERLRLYKQVAEVNNKPYLIVGTKIDIAEQEKVNFFTELCNREGLEYNLTSAKNREGVDGLFSDLISGKYISIHGDEQHIEKVKKAKENIKLKCRDLKNYADKLIQNKMCSKSHFDACYDIANKYNDLTDNYFDGKIDYPTYKYKLKEVYNTRKTLLNEKKETKQKIVDILQTVTALGILLGIVNLAIKGKFSLFKFKEDTADKIVKIQETASNIGAYFEIVKNNEEVFSQKKPINNRNSDSSDSDIVDEVVDTPRGVDKG